VQTEARGDDEPVLETLVYSGGRIAHQERSSCADLPADEQRDEAVRKRLERQHRDIVRRARHGEFAVDQTTLAQLLPETEPLSELLGRRLAEAGVSPMELRFAAAPAAGGLVGRLTVESGADGRLAAGVRVVARLVGRGLPAAMIWTGETGEDGGVQVVATLPAGVRGAVVFAVEHGAGRLRLDVDAAGRIKP